LFLILGGFTQHRALLRRKMRYPTLAGINLMAVVVSSTVGILAAVGGLGFWALVLKELGSYLALLAGMWWAEPWRPGAPKVDASVRHHVDFSKYLFGSQLVRYASRSADRLLLGLHFGATTAGLYERSISLLYLPVAQLAMPMSSVINPSLARVQDDPEKFREVYLEATRALSWMVVPLSALFVVTADELVSVLLGEAWMDATALFALIGASMAFQALDVTRVWIFTPLGRTDRMFRFTTLTSIIMLLAIVSAARLGPEVLASVRLGVMACIFVGGLVYTHRGAPVVLTDTLRAVGPPFGAGFAVVSLRWVPIRDLTGSPLGALVAASAAAAVVTAVVLAASGDAKRLRTALGTLRRR
jgi:O-antigen/teichoic acid export membrane protein